MKFYIKNHHTLFQIVPFISILVMCFIAFVPELTHAIQSGVASPQLDAAGGSAGITNTDPRIFIASMIQIALGVLGTVFAGLMVLAGYWFLIARGREDYIDNAKKTMLRAVTGLLIVLLSYGITSLVLGNTDRLNDASGDSAGGNQGGGVSVSTCCMACSRTDGSSICNFDTYNSSNRDMVIGIYGVPATGRCSSLGGTIPGCPREAGETCVINEITSSQCTTSARP